MPKFKKPPVVSDWRRAWRWFSVQAMVLAGAINGTWAVIPDSMKASLPTGLIQWLTIALLFLGVVGRLVDQTPKE